MMDAAAPRVSQWTVALDRHEYVSTAGFDEIHAAVLAGLGRPDFAAFVERIDAIGNWDDFKAAVEAQAGSSGLLVFLELDIGSVIVRDPAAAAYRSVRIIAGNPVTMESMTRTTPGAAAFAPVTILVFEAADGVHLRYDTITSAEGGELSAEAAAIAQHLDEAVLTLLADAAGTVPIALRSEDGRSQ